MNIFKFIATILTLVLFGGFITVAFMRSGEYIEFQKNKLRNESIDSCYSISKFTSDKTTEGIKIEEPIIDKFEQCLQRKGIK